MREFRIHRFFRLAVIGFALTMPVAVTADFEFEIDARTFERGNMAANEQYRAGGPPVIAFGGVDPAEVEYDIPFPLAGRYTLSLLVAVAELRPVDVYFDGKPVGTVCDTRRTKSWNSIDAHWDGSIELTVSEPGEHTVRLITRNTPPPHIAKLKLTTSVPIEPAWMPYRPNAKVIVEDIVRIDHDQFQGETNLTAAEPKPEAIRRAVMDLIETYGERYPQGPKYLERLDQLEKTPNQGELSKLRFESLFLNNPVIDFDRIVLVRRHRKGPAQGFPTNFQSLSSLPKGGYDDEIMFLSTRLPQDALVSFYKPSRDTLLSDLDLDFDASRILFSAVGDNNRWQLFESDMATGATVQKTKGDADIDFYDACYLPDGRIITTSTAPMIGVPCVDGDSHVANLFLIDEKQGGMRQLCFDQEHNWCPTVLNNGRVLYTRWEYADTPHANTRLLFHCNPDGTSQLEYYGSNSYWPTSVFMARPLPGHPSKVIAVIGGHHDAGRIGELVIFDPALGRHEADGAVQKIPGFGKKIVATVADGLTRKAWPKFVHPFPLSEKYFLVAAKPTPESLFGIYLVDIFDNMILIKELPDNGLFEPIPLKAQASPPIIPDRVDLKKTEAAIAVTDLRFGPGLEGIPPGVVKELMVFTYHYSYHDIGGLLGSVGQDGPWDIRGVLGTVPVEADGSAHFQVPANLPIGILPLDENGQALQVMRSWMTAMPGENLHCLGCHEEQNGSPPALQRLPMALRTAPRSITPYSVPDPEGKTLLGRLNVRGFSFQDEVQPVLDRHCVSCHNGEAEKQAKTAKMNGVAVGTSLDGKPIALDLSSRPLIGWTSQMGGNSGWHDRGGKWTVAYDNLQRFVRRPGIESDYHLLMPMEFSPNTTELVQILRKGHYGVQLDADAWNRLLTWINMNTPYHGTWSGMNNSRHVPAMAQRRMELAKLYGTETIGFEEKRTDVSTMPKTTAPPAFVPTTETPVEVHAWTPPEMDAIETKSIDLGDGVTIRLRKIPVYGKLEKPFWIGEFEVTNAQFRKFDPEHDSGHESRQGYQFGRRGYDVNGDSLPVVRVRWNRAQEFCRWLGEKTKMNIDLPTEIQWEYACRAGTTTPFWFGDADSNFSDYANMGDRRLKEFVADTSHAFYTGVWIPGNPNPFDDRIPKDERFDDGAFLQTVPGRYQPNPFGLYDMHGNVAEWTGSETAHGEKIVKGGSWYDRPYRCASDYRISYPPYQGVFNVGFRIVAEEVP